jgi:hypothetical protein
MRTFKLAMFIPMLWASTIFAAQSMPLTLPEAERMAIANAPELQRLQATEESLSQQSVAEGQLSDPKLMAGAINVPTNTFSFNQDDMTMIAVGLEQSFPHGHSLAIKSRQTQALANAEKRKAQEQIVMLLQNVRKTWLDLYYWTHAARIIHSNQNLLANLLKVTKTPCRDSLKK